MVKRALFLLSVLIPASAFAVRGPSDPMPVGWRAFPSSSVWYTEIDSAPISSSDTLYMNIINGHAGHNIKADFGTVFGDGSFNGIPYNLEWSTATARQGVPLTTYATESDTPPVGGVPISSDAIAEQDYTADPAGDRHLLLQDFSSTTVGSYLLYEMFQSSRTDATGLHRNASQLTVWNSTSNDMRTDGWTSADASGMAMLPGLIRWDEIQAGSINHAIRITLSLTYKHIWPASHDATSGGPLNPPLGLRVRIKKSLDCSGLSTTNQIICTAGKKYGFIIADNGGDWFFSGAPNPNWNDTDLHDGWAAFGPVINFLEVVDQAPYIVSPTSYEMITPTAAPALPKGLGGGVRYGGGVHYQ